MNAMFARDRRRGVSRPDSGPNATRSIETTSRCRWSQHFNHCISYLPPTDSRPGLFLDGTASWHPTDTLPEMDQGARVLVVRGEDAQLEDIAWTTPRQNAEARRYEFQLNADGSGRFALTMQPRGNQAVPMRNFLDAEPALRDENLERALARELGEVTLAQVQATAPNALDTPVEVIVEGTATRLATAQGDALALLPTPRAASLQQRASAPSRELPLLLGVPEGERHVTRYRLPKGFLPTELPAPVSLDATFGSYRQNWTLDGDTLVVERRLDLNSPRIEPAEYPDFRAFARRVDEADRRVVLLRRSDR